MTSEDDRPGDLGDQPRRPPLTPDDNWWARFRRGTPSEAMDAMRDAVNQGLENAGMQPGDLPPELAAALEAQRQELGEAREMNLMSMGMQAAGLHECFVSLVGAGFTESEALYYMAKVNPGI